MKFLPKKNRIIASTLFVFSAILTHTVTQTALADTNSPGIDHRQNNQKHQIINGIDSGS